MMTDLNQALQQLPAWLRATACRSMTSGSTAHQVQSCCTAMNSQGVFDG